MTVSISGTGGVTFNDSSVQNTAATGFGFKNRIINGAMVIDQRNAGAAVTANGSFPVDRFFQSFIAGEVAISGQQDSSAPTGFVNSTKITITTAEVSVGADDRSAFQHRIEGTNVADLAWGTANAQTVTLSFWVRSSVTGTFGGALRNSANNRSYPFTYSISVANTWEQKSVTIPGDTTGTWLTTTGIGIVVNFSLMAGTNFAGTAGAWAAAGVQGATGQVQLATTLNATWYITGVQLEKGSTATSFDYRPYGTELALCQRYYYKTFPAAANSALNLVGYISSTTEAVLNGQYPVVMRTAPTALEQSGTASNYRITTSTGAANCSSVPVHNSSTNEYGPAVTFTVASGLVAGQGALGRTGSTTGASGYLAWSAEL
jgi:hypothetical protein